MNSFQDCYWQINNQVLTIGNDCIERSWFISNDGPVPQSIINKTNRDSWIQNSVISGFNIGAGGSLMPQGVLVNGMVDDDSGIGAPHLKITVELPAEGHDYRWTLRIYPMEAFIRHEMAVKRAPKTLAKMDNQTLELQAGEMDANNAASFTVPNDRLDLLTLEKKHCRWTAVRFEDQTDHNNNLVHRSSGLLYRNEQRRLQGNLLLLSDTTALSGLWILKESPTSIAHLHYPGADYQMMGHTLIVTGTGLDPEDLSESEYYPSYGCCIGVTDGSEDGALAAMDRYYRCLRTYKPERDAAIISNTWGDRNKDGRIREPFVLEEIRAAAALGITCVQIDDGWEAGTTVNSVKPGGKWGGYYADENATSFWEVDPIKFPQGLGTVAEEADKYGISIGLWFAPDFANDYAHWKEDAQTLIQLHRNYHIRQFKLDGNKILSKLGELRLVDMMRTIHIETNGDVTFNMDATADIRLGYFRNTHYGNIFLENRYTDWQNYYPHFTLRNLWQLSSYLPARQLQLEFLNVERNQDAYGENDPFAPANCGIAYSFAVTMFASPLAWMELSSLSIESREQLQPLLEQYRGIQPHILGGHILPIGDEPDGSKWTGLQSITGADSGYLLLFRERTPSEHGVYRLRGSISGDIMLRKLMNSKGAEESVQWQADRQQLEVSMSRPFSFALYHYCVS